MRLITGLVALCDLIHTNVSLFNNHIIATNERRKHESYMKNNDGQKQRERGLNNKQIHDASQDFLSKLIVHYNLLALSAKAANWMMLNIGLSVVLPVITCVFRLCVQLPKHM